MTKLGEAYVSVNADFGPFDRLVAQKLGKGFAPAGEKAGKDFTKGFDKTSGGVLLPFNRGLDRVAERTDKIADGFEKTTKAAKAAAAEVSKVEPLEDLSATARLDLRIGGANAEIEQLKATLADLTGRPQTLDVTAAVGTALRDLERVEAKRDALTRERAEVKIDVDQGATGVFSKLTDGAQRLFSALGGSGGGGGLNGVTTRISAGFLSFGISLGPVAAIVGALAVTIGVALVGALAALVASLAAAAAGVAAIGAAFAGVLLPGVVLAVAVIARLAQIFQAMKAVDTAADAVGKNAAAGSTAAAAAADQQASAARALADANVNLGRATTAAYREMADAAEKASDAIRGVTDAQLTLDDAKLSVKEAELALKELEEQADVSNGALIEKFSDIAVSFNATAINQAVEAGGGSEADALKIERAVLRIRQARQAEKNAVDGVSDATRDASRAQEENNKFLAQGIGASVGLQAAQRGVRDAKLQVVAADRAAATATEGLGAAAATAAVELGKLNSVERHLVRTLQDVREALRGAFSPAVNAVLSGFDRALSRLPEIVNPLRGSFLLLGQAVGRTFDTFARGLADPRTTSALRDFIAAGARIATTFTSSILTPFLRIVRDIAISALPFLESGLRKVGDALTGLSATGPSRIRDIVTSVVGHLKSWLALTGQISRVFLAFVTAGAGEGKKLVDQITEGTRKLADFLQSAEGQNKIREFFADVIPLAREFVKFLGLLTVGIFKFGQQAGPVLGVVFDGMNKLLGLLSKTGGLAQLLPGIGPLVGIFGGPTSSATSAIDTHVAALERLKDRTKELTDAQIGSAQAQRDLTSAREDARRQLSDLASSANNAQLGRRGAVLDLRQAQGSLANLGPNASADDRARAELAVDQAQQRVRDTTREAARAQKDSNEAREKGVKGIPSYVAALDRVADVLEHERKAGSAYLDGARLIREENAKPAEAPKFLAAAASVPGIGLVVEVVRRNWDEIKAATSDLWRFVSENFVKGVNDLGRLASEAASFVAARFEDMRRLSARPIRLLVRSIDVIAGAWSTMLNALSKVPGFGWAKLAADRIDRARGRARAFTAALDDIPTLKDIRVRVSVDKLPKALKRLLEADPEGPLGVSVRPPASSGIERATGGIVPGFGTGDTVPAWLTPMEYVVRQQVVRQFGPTVFADINEGRLDPRIGYTKAQPQQPRVTQTSTGRRFATGGLVGVTAAPERPVVNATFPITVPGGGPPDPVALGVSTARVIEDRFGGNPNR